MAGEIVFTEEDYLEACSELEEPAVIDWELFTETHGVKIYRLYNQESGLYSYKVYGSLKMKPENCVRVYTDIEYRKKWDDYVKELYPIEENGVSGIYWRVKFPFPLANRDYTYVRGVRELTRGDGRRVWIVLARASQFSTKPPVSGVVRVSEYNQSLALTEDNNGGTKAYMKYYDNPGGMIPNWLINWAAKKGVPGFLDEMNKACDGYHDYLSSCKSRGTAAAAVPYKHPA